MGKKNNHTPRPILDVQAPPALRVNKDRRTRQLKKLRPADPKWLLVIAIVLVLLGGVFIRKYSDARNEMMLNDPAKLAAHIGKVLALPTDETPTLATVKDSSKVRTQTFFKNAQDGDKVLIYSKSGRAVLYRPTSKKIIEFAAISIGTDTEKQH